MMMQTPKLCLISAAIRRSFCTEVPHIPVMVKEVLNYLQPNRCELILDMTFGAGGHSRRILEENPNIKLLTLDRDPLAYDYSLQLAKQYPDRLLPMLGRFSELPRLFKENGVRQNSLDGVLFDFGCSSMQFDVAQRGFSVSQCGPLDMRMDGDRFPDSATAADVLANADEDDLAKILKVYGDEKQAKKIARAIVETRYMCQKLRTTDQLAALVDSVLGDEERRTDKLHRPTAAATKTFQALRIFVNDELNEINYGLILAHRYLKLGGRLVAITFHSLEDTVVKRHLLGNLIENSANPLPLKYSSHNVYHAESLLENIKECSWEMLHRHVIVPRYEEVERNPRSRSAKLRAAIRIK